MNQPILITMIMVRIGSDVLKMVILYGKLGSNQSPILLPEQGKIESEVASYLFSKYEERDGIANYLNTTIYINTTTDFGSSYTKIINGESVPFKAT